MDNKKKIIVYIDGFNLYHALVQLKRPSLKWLDLRSLAEKFIDPKTDVIHQINYFSAVATFMSSDIVSRHRAYIEALETYNIKFIEGNFKDKWHSYSNKTIQLKWKKHEEKETDVNISIYMVRDAIKNIPNKIIIMTNDTAIVPAIKMVKEANKQIQIKLLTPPSFKTHDSLRQAIHPGTCSQLTEGQLLNSLLPEKISKSNGKIITRPKKYDP